MQSRTSIVPKSLINVQLGRLEIEVDVSIIDRIAGVLNPGPLYQTAGSGTNGKMYSSFLSGPTLVSIVLDLILGIFPGKYIGQKQLAAHFQRVRWI